PPSRNSLPKNSSHIAARLAANGSVMRCKLNGPTADGSHEGVVRLGSESSRRQFNAKNRTAVMALPGNSSPVRLCRVLRDSKAEADSLGLSGDERLEQSRGDLRGGPGSRVGNFDHGGG